MKDIEVMVEFSQCGLTPEERILAKERYDRAERSDLIPIGVQMLFAHYVMTPGLEYFVHFIPVIT